MDVQQTVLRVHHDSAISQYLGIAKVQYFIQKLVYEHKVALDALLAEFTPKVILEQRHNLQNTVIIEP